ncbi:D-alanyl-D-alanine carboxypeptidase [Evansella sp. LMS18]|uniref:D-alanyl-D-alanine carboxypeptidase family protein n=1 Tax=Evansella sp. LMS18 TaxID=2924033 RepID=UPI0020D12EC7|nr:D-alanyl-D-alanine carboxypeptidase family protein [Evansella sp. LMS18]UTR09571.1 D-alanyl-D-alanine carboxypeptidase [Evansella sp. LMS18]
MSGQIIKVILIIIFIAAGLQLPASAAVYPGNVSAKGAILMEQESGRILYEKEADTPMRIASITKIMTAIIAVESGQMEEWVTVSENAQGTEGSSIYLVAGEKIKLKDLVYGLMLRSGNDAAVAIAEHVGGSLDGFVYMMEEKRRELGMNNTVFANPHGLDDHEEHYSTAHDMAILTRYAMNDPLYREITGAKSYRSVSKDESYRVFNNKNRLLTQLYKHSTGGKTGYTKRARRTLVSTAEKSGKELIAVTINAPSDWNDHISMFEWGFNSFEVMDIIKKGVVKDIEDDYYHNKVAAEYTFSYPLSEEEENKVKKILSLYRPPEDGRWEEEGHPYPIGTVQVELENETIGIIPLRYTEEAPKEKPFWKTWFEQLFMAAGVKTGG